MSRGIGEKENNFLILMHFLNLINFVFIIYVGENIVLERSVLSTPCVVSINETFDWNRCDGNYCQIICLTPESKIITDIILWFDHILSLIYNRREDIKVQSELPISVKFICIL